MVILAPNGAHDNLGKGVAGRANEPLILRGDQLWGLIENGFQYHSQAESNAPFKFHQHGFYAPERAIQDLSAITVFVVSCDAASEHSSVASQGI